jgi:hypothetical protein
MMVWGRIILNKSYGPVDFASALAVTLGCFIFVLNRGALPAKYGSSGELEAPHPELSPAYTHDVLTRPSMWFEQWFKPHSEMHQYLLGSVIMAWRILRRGTRPMLNRRTSASSSCPPFLLLLLLFLLLPLLLLLFLLLSLLRASV